MHTHTFLCAYAWELPRYGAVIDAEEDVRAANLAFYEAFEARDMDAMSEVWEHSDRVVCTHPGWTALRGWGAVSGSWFALFRADNPMQFILTNESVTVEGDVGWVNVDENLISDNLGGTVAALNLFVFDGERWRMIVHHGSPVVTTTT
jgi:ketosteroid isomerase-like protein